MHERLAAGIISGMSDEAEEATPKKTPVWVQVADAGFGAAVEAHGFRRVGKAMWELDGDGITHRIRLHAGPSKLPGTFRDHISIAYNGYDELCARVGLTPRGTFIPGTKIRCRDHWRLWNRHLSAEAVRYREVVDRHKAEYGENLEQGNPLFFYEFAEKIPCLIGERFGNRSSYWQVDISRPQEA
ncbi:MAG: hypothetical protein VYB54_10410, partial [Pseudomonadota bacterium]|nr:hypothetical protein [Pseudomonadota bacterium]